MFSEEIRGLSIVILGEIKVLKVKSKDGKISRLRRNGTVDLWLEVIMIFSF